MVHKIPVFVADKGEHNSSNDTILIRSASSHTATLYGTLEKHSHVSTLRILNKNGTSSSTNLKDTVPSQIVVHRY